MADYIEREDSAGGGGAFLLGVLTGAVLGAGLGMLLAPKSGSELRGALGHQARNFGSMAQDQYRRAADAASGWAEKGREFVDRTREAVSRGTEQAREYTGAPGATGTTDFGRS